jgi:chemotaxis protein MotD
MMDISVLGGASGAGAASGIGRQTGSGGDADAGGFSDALNKASGGKHDSAEQSTAGQQAGDGTDGSTSTAPRRPSTQPLIDLGSTSLAAQAQMKEKASGSADKETKTTEHDGKPKGKHADEADLQDLSDRLDDDAVTVRKGAKETKADGADDQKVAPDDSALSDVLSLLKQVPTDGTAAAAFAAMAGAKPEGKVSTEPKEKSVASVKAKDEMSVDAGLTGVDTTADVQ